MQHKILVEQFESYLAGKPSREFADHLAVCPDCRAEIAAMQEVNDSLRSVFAGAIRNPQMESFTAPQPPLGFYSSVSNRIISEQQSQAWSLFSPGVAFFRRVAFASL